MSSEEVFVLRAGLQDPAFKYLTSDDFGFKPNVLGSFLGRKQIWTLELSQDETVHLKSHCGRYLMVDKYGDVKCEVKSREEDGKFAVEYSLDGSGRWAFRNIKYGRYLSGNGTVVRCLSKKATEDEMSLWSVHMASHPQIVMYNKRRKRYFGLDENGIHCQDIVPWGPKSMFTLEYCAGKYLIKACNDKYLHKDGHLTVSREAGTRFTFELQVNKNSKLEGIAFKDNDRRYLSGVGGMSAVLKSKRNHITDDEIFRLEESHPQIILIAPNGKNISIRSGNELMANSSEESEKEIFQLEFDSPSGKWYFQTFENNLWCLNQNGGLEASSNKQSNECLFELEWMCGAVAVIASNGKYMGIRQNGQLIAKNDGVGPNETFKIKLINRPFLVLKSDFGYIGRKISQRSRGVYACNKSMYEVLTLEHGEKGFHFIKGDNGEYWNVKDSSIVGGSKPEPFVLEFMGTSQIAIFAPNDKYIDCQKDGTFKATTQLVHKTCLMQF